MSADPRKPIWVHQCFTSSAADGEWSQFFVVFCSSLDSFQNGDSPTDDSRGVWSTISSFRLSSTPATYLGLAVVPAQLCGGDCACDYQHAPCLSFQSRNAVREEKR